MIMSQRQAFSNKKERINNNKYTISQTNFFAFSHSLVSRKLKKCDALRVASKKEQGKWNKYNAQK